MTEKGAGYKCKLEFEIYLCSFPRATIMNHHKLGNLKRQKFIPSHFWRPEVRNQSVGRAVLPLKAPGEDPSSFSLQ